MYFSLLQRSSFRMTFVAARKRSLGQGNASTGVCRGGGAFHPWEGVVLSGGYCS